MRRFFLILSISVLLISVVFGCRRSKPEGPRELKLAYVMAPGGPAHEAARHFADLVKEKTTGQIIVKLYPSAQLGNDMELSEGLTIGSVDLVCQIGSPRGYMHRK